MNMYFYKVISSRIIVITQLNSNTLVVTKWYNEKKGQEGNVIYNCFAFVIVGCPMLNMNL